MHGPFFIDVCLTVDLLHGLMHHLPYIRNCMFLFGKQVKSSSILSVHLVLANVLLVVHGYWADPM